MNISLLQWNVWIFEKKENLLELIKAVKPDIICLQELTIGSTFQDGANVAEYLAIELGYNQFHKSIPNLAPSDGVGDLANGILTRFPIVSTDWQWVQEPTSGGKMYDDQYRLYTEAKIQVGEIALRVGTTHMSYTHKFSNTPLRQAESDRLLNILESKNDKYIITGDFNAVPESYLVPKVERLLKHAGPDYEVKTWTTKPFSYNGFEETDLNWRLDYVFTSRDIEAVSSEVVQTDFSDHLPILTQLRIG